MSIPLRILILEDSPDDAELEIAELERVGYQCRWERVETRAEFLAGLTSPDYDLILADYNLPAFDGLTALNLYREQDLDRPLIFISSNDDAEIAVESLKGGAVDYVLKDNLSRLELVVQRALDEKEEQHQLSNIVDNYMLLRSQALVLLKERGFDVSSFFNPEKKYN